MAPTETEAAAPVDDAPSRPVPSETNGPKAPNNAPLLKAGAYLIEWLRDPSSAPANTEQLTYLASLCHHVSALSKLEAIAERDGAEEEEAARAAEIARQGGAPTSIEGLSRDLSLVYLARIDRAVDAIRLRLNSS